MARQHLMRHLLVLTLRLACAEESDGENVALDTAAHASLLDVVASVFLRPARRHRRAVAHRAVVFSYAPDASLSSAGWRPSLAMDIAAVVSQSDLVRFLHDHATELGPLRSATVDELRLGAAPVRAVPADASALSAFQALVRHDVSALGIVSPVGGTLVGNLSASDLRCLLPHQFGRLALPVARFVAEQCASSLMVVSVSPRSTLGAVLDRFAFSCVHHVYVVDGAAQKKTRAAKRACNAHEHAHAFLLKRTCVCVLFLPAQMRAARCA
jgi:CBS domain-containing protein